MTSTVTFNLKTPNSKEETLIYLGFLYRDLKIKMSIGEMVKPKYWIASEQRVWETIQYNEEKNINTRLKVDKDNILNAVRDHLNKYGTIKPDILRKKLRDILRPNPSEEPDGTSKGSFLKTIEEYIKNCQKKARTKLSYGTTLNILKQYQQARRCELTFSLVTIMKNDCSYIL